MFAAVCVGFALFDFAVSNILTFTFLSDIGVLLAAMFFVCVLAIPGQVKVAEVLFTLAWSIEIAILFVYWPVFYPLLQLGLPEWYDLGIHLVIPIFILAEMILNKLLIRLEHGGIYLLPLVVIYTLLLASLSLYYGEWYPTITFRDLYSFTLMGILLGAIAIVFFAGYKITSKRREIESIMPVESATAK
jgi:hypothetical protein